MGIFDPKIAYRFRLEFERISDGHRPVQLGHDLETWVDPGDKMWRVGAVGDDAPLGSGDQIDLAVLDYIAKVVDPAVDIGDFIQLDLAVLGYIAKRIEVLRVV